jgi:hypothetical protein
MYNQYPNPIRLFITKRDQWFIDVLEKLDIPVHLFSDVRDSQLSQIVFSIEASKLKNQRAKKSEVPDLSLFEKGMVEGFIPRFTFLKGLRETFKKLELDFSDLKEGFLNHESIKLYNSKLKRSREEWFNEIPRDRMDEAYINLADIIFDALLIPAFSKSSETEITRDNLQEIVKKENEGFATLLFNLLNQDIVNAIRDKTWKEGDNDNRIINLSSKEASKEDKPEVFELTTSDFRGRSNILNSVVIELIKYFENPEIIPVDEVAKDEEGTEAKVSEKEKEPIEGSKFLSHALSLEMILYQPYPENERIPVVTSHLRDISNHIEDYPKAFWDILGRIYHTFASGLTTRTMSYKAFEKLFRNYSKDFWDKCAKSFTFNDEKQNETVENLVAVIWSQFLITRSSIEQYTKDEREASDLFKLTLSTLEHHFWMLERGIFGLDLTKTPMQFWSKFAQIDNLIAQDKDAAERIFNRYKDFINSVDTNDKTLMENLDINELDLISIYRRTAFEGIQSGNVDLKDEVSHFITKYENALEALDVDSIDLPSGFNMTQEKAVIESLKQSMEVMGTHKHEHDGKSQRKLSTQRQRRRRR